MPWKSYLRWGRISKEEEDEEEEDDDEEEKEEKEVCLDLGVGFKTVGTYISISMYILHIIYVYTHDIKTRA